MECNAFGVRAIGHIVRSRDNGPSGTPFGRIGYTVGRIACTVCMPDQLVCINQSRQHKFGFYAEGVTFQSPGSPRQRRTLGLHAARNPNPNGVLQMRDAAYQSFARHEHRHARWAIVQPRWGNHIAVSPITRGTRRGREPRAMECNAFGVCAIGHIVRLRDNGPSRTSFGRIGNTVWNRNPNGVLQMRRDSHHLR